MATNKVLRRAKIKMRIRKKVSGTQEVPRLSVFKSNTTIYAQLIDDITATTLAEANSKELSDKRCVNIDLSKQVGLKLADKAKEKGIENVVFDRNGYLYHGKVKALADGAREGGLKF
jgi:large subunit ribosomal protein L18